MGSNFVALEGAKAADSDVAKIADRIPCSNRKRSDKQESIIIVAALGWLLTKFCDKWRQMVIFFAPIQCGCAVAPKGRMASRLMCYIECHYVYPTGGAKALAN